MNTDRQHEIVQTDAPSNTFRPANIASLEDPGPKRDMDDLTMYDWDGVAGWFFLSYYLLYFPFSTSYYCWLVLCRVVVVHQHRHRFNHHHLDWLSVRMDRGQYGLHEGAGNFLGIGTARLWTLVSNFEGSIRRSSTRIKSSTFWVARELYS